MTKTTIIQFTVPTTGVGRIDYSAAENFQTIQTIQNILNQEYPQAAIASNQFDDYAELALTANWLEYAVGTNANLAKANSWTQGATSRSIAFYSDVEFLVKYNFADAVVHKVPSNILKTSDKRTERLFVKALSNFGTLKVWIEG